jgi:CheY-like chemotaxis protein
MFLMNKILIIEDNEDIIHIIKESLPKYNVFSTTTWQEFIQLTVDHNFSHFIVDMNLGQEFTGHQFINYIKKNKIDGKVIVWSGMSKEIMDSEIRESAFAVVEKTNMKELINLIEDPHTFPKQLSPEEVFHSMVITYHHHFRNKLTVIQAALPQDEKGQRAQKSVDYLIQLLKDIEANKLISLPYCGDKRRFLDYPKK